MAYPTYFSKFPDIKYPYKINRAGVVDTFTIKDYFHLLKVRENVFARDTIYSPMTIIGGERPDQLSHRIYDDESYYWIILQINEIVDVHNEWPLSNYDLDQYIVKKYGSIEVSNQVHHYETIETFDEEGNRVLPGRGGGGIIDRGGLAQSGLRVPENFTFTYRPFPGRQVTKTLSGSTGLLPSCTPITNRQYEYDINEDKSQIWILQEKYLPDYLREVSLYAARISDIDTSLEVSDI